LMGADTKPHFSGRNQKMAKPDRRETIKPLST
jgi:hypothetical protein